jgi:hypothetical protein
MAIIMRDCGTIVHDTSRLLSFPVQRFGRKFRAKQGHGEGAAAVPTA